MSEGSGMNSIELVKQLAPICKAEGIRKIRVGDVEIEFGGEKADPKAVEKFYQAMESSMPTDEDILFHSAPGYVPTAEREQQAPMPKARGRRV